MPAEPQIEIDRFSLRLGPRAPTSCRVRRPRCAVRGASNPARWGTLHSVLPLHREKPGADFGFLLLGHEDDAGAVLDYHARNREHLAATSPIRADSFYTDEFWRAALVSARAAFDADRQMHCFLFDGKAVVGVINLSNFVRGAFQACHLGYSIDARLEGRGLMAQVVGRVVEFAFTDLGMHRVMANHLPENARSARLLLRLGFEQEGIAKKYLLINGEWRDHVLTARVNDAWRLPASDARKQGLDSPPPPRT